MATSVVMPALEMAQETGKVVSWLKREGDQVAKGEPLLEIETDKAVVEIEAQADGTLGGVTAAVGDVVPVGQTIAWLLAPGETVPVAESVAPSARRMDRPAAAAVSAVSPTAPPVVDREVRVSPKARRLAAERGLDLRTIPGTGAGGEILTDDVLRAAASQAPAGPASARDLGTIGRLMAERTTASWTTVPHFFLSREVDATRLTALRNRLIPAIEASHGVRLTHTDLLLALVARALVHHTRLNASWSDGTIALNAEINIALAMAVDEAVVTAVIRNAGAAALGDIARRRKELTERARANRLQPADIVGATFTISNLGMFGVDDFTAIIVPPQAAILATGAIVDRAVVADGEVAVRPTLRLTLSSDHRVVGGAAAAAFMRDLAELIQMPEVVFS